MSSDTSIDRENAVSPVCPLIAESKKRFTLFFLFLLGFT